MKRCPTCNRTYADLSLNFCLDDGTPLTSDAAPPDLNATIRYPPPRSTSEPSAEPPPTEIYHPTVPTAPPRPAASPAPPPPPPPQPQWSPTPPPPPAKKSNAVWWILGGLAAVLVIGVGLVVMIIALASLGSNSNTSNVNRGENNRNANVTVNANVTINANANANANVSTTIPTSLADDFSNEKWRTGTLQYGRLWYANGEYRMTSKEGMFLVSYAPSNDYSTENATVKVRARSVDSSVPNAGFGLMVHCLQSRSGQLEDYALLIFPSSEPEYEIVMHKQGNQSSIVKRTKSSAIRSGSTPNELEIRTNGNQLSFYINGQFLNTITDRENFRRGRAGFYTSDVFEVAFDDLQINRTQPN